MVTLCEICFVGKQKNALPPKQHLQGYNCCKRLIAELKLIANLIWFILKAKVRERLEIWKMNGNTLLRHTGKHQLHFALQLQTAIRFDFTTYGRRIEVESSELPWTPGVSNPKATPECIAKNPGYLLCRLLRYICWSCTTFKAALPMRIPRFEYCVLMCLK